MSEEKFEKASRLKYRFESPKGSLTVEDLWDLPLTTTRQGNACLDDIAKALHRQTKEDDNVSFVAPTVPRNDIANAKLDIVKHIIATRLAENAVDANRKEAKEKKQQILSLIANKENEALAGQSIEDLRKLAESL